MAFSNHLRGASELMLVADIKPGFVEAPEQLVSYATRLKRLLQLLLEGRRSAAEKTLLPSSGPIERLDTIYNTQWAISERPQRSQLIVSAVFDTSWEAYFRNLQRNAGALLDAIFVHCEGYAGHSCQDDGYDAFTRFIRARQVQTHFFHSATPDLTVADLRLLRGRARRTLGARQALPSVEEEERQARERMLEHDDPVTTRAAEVAARERAAFLQAAVDLDRLFPERAELLGTRDAKQVYRDGMTSLFESSLDESLRTAARALGWTASPRPDAAVPRSCELQAELANIQGNILQSYNAGRAPSDALTVGCMLMLQCDGPTSARAFLARLLARNAITRASDHTLRRGERREGSGALHLNVALSHAGMVRLGIAPELLAELPAEFREGMAARAGLLGDVGPYAHPSSWEALPANWSGDGAGTISLSSVDLVLIAQRTLRDAERSTPHTDWSARHPLKAELEALLGDAPGIHVLHVQALCRQPRDHFGFGEGGKLPESQPVPDVTLAGEPLREHDADRGPAWPLGELLLGYRNRHGEQPLGTEQRQLLQNGSFLVVRKLRQDVRAFEHYLQGAVFKRFAETPDKVRSYVLGRKLDGQLLGQPVPHAPERASECPLHAHVLRTRPPLADAPRLMRRSFPYGSSYDPQEPHDPKREPKDRGLLFMAYNASIAEQFEVVQRWVAGANVTGLSSSANDLVAGNPQVRNEERSWPYAKGALPDPERPFVSLRWGMYLFVPSLPALAWISAGPHADDPLMREAGERRIQQLQAIEDVELARRAWKEVLENQQERGPAHEVWSAIHAHHDGRLPTHYGVLISRRELASEVLRDDGTRFSVSEYHRRLGRCFGVGEHGETHYIGLDGAAHAVCSSRPNELLLALDPALVAETAREACSALLQSGPSHSLLALAARVTSAVCARFIGLPVEGAAAAALMKSFAYVSRYCFQPYPESERALIREAVEAGSRIVAAYQGYDGAGAPAGSLARMLGPQGPAALRWAVIGAIVGFAPPAMALIVQLGTRLARDGELSRLASAARDPQRVRAWVRDALLDAPVPPTLYRRIRDGARLAGRPVHDLRFRSEYAVIGTRAVALDGLTGAPDAEAISWLFGGAAGRTVHGCPGRAPALAVLVGVTQALLAYPALRVSGATQLELGAAPPDDAG